MSGAWDRALELTRPAGRRAAGAFLAEGPHVIGDALRAGAEVLALFADAGAAGDAEVAAIAARVRAAGADVHDVPARKLAKLADTSTPQGVVAVVRTPRPPSDPFRAPGMWLLLDGVQDPGNAGTLLRSAEAFGVRGVVVSPGTADPWSGKVLRAGQGAHFRLTILDASAPGALDGVLAAFASAGGLVWTADRDGDDVYAAPAAPERAMLALGNEARGVSDAVRARSARRVSVPQSGRAESLNVAMAGSILLSWISRRRGAPAS